jgi:four helix bundle protein
MKNQLLSSRLITFSKNVIIVLRGINNSLETVIIKKQLIRSATSVGANYEEAQGATSKADFHNKIRISLKEIRESNYWLKLLKYICSTSKDVSLDDLIDESEQIKKILGTIAKKTKAN